MKINVIILLAAVCGMFQSTVATAAQAVSEIGHITGFETGWSQNTMSVYLDVSMVNPTNPSCSTIAGGYALDPNDPGVKVHEAAIMGAYFAGKKVYVRVEGCVFTKPKIIAVGVLN